MVVEKTYTLCGYIEYVPTPVGFVTPVFLDEQGEYFVQADSRCGQLLEWQPLPKVYLPLLRLITMDLQEGSTRTVLYAFKNHHDIRVSSGESMAAYFKDNFLPTDDLVAAQITSFLQHWNELEVKKIPCTKEDIWRLCLDVVKSESQIFAQIFSEKVKVIDLKEDVLRLQISDKTIRKVFEKQFLGSIRQVLSKDTTGVGIVIEEEPLVSVPSFPFVYFGGEGTIPTQGSYVLQTSIRSHQNFDNFIIGDFNEKAYHRSLEFIHDNNCHFLGVKGMWGVGKSYLVNSIAKHFAEASQNKVGFFRIIKVGETEEVSSTDIDQFERNATDKDVIIIDDLDSITGNKEQLRRLIKILKGFSDEGKKVVISYRSDGFSIEFQRELSKEYEEVALSKPSDTDKVKIIKEKTIDYNLSLSQDKIIDLTKISDVNSIRDIEKSLIRTCLIEDMTSQDWNHLLTPNQHILDHFLPSKIEPFFHQYFTPHQQAWNWPVNHYSVNAISNFLIFLSVPHHGTSHAIPKVTEMTAGYLYSFETMTHQFFENDKFREAIREIIKFAYEQRGKNDDCFFV